MLKRISIKALYVPALAEGEGVGTAYEYFAKRLVLSSWVKTLPPIKRVLIAGLPEKYGSSLDFMQLVHELGATAVIIDDRPQAIAKFQQSLQNVQAEGWLTDFAPTCHLVADFAQMDELKERFDLAISSEVVQRIPANLRINYSQRLAEMATAVSFFCPNGDNPAHTNISGLSGLDLAEMQSLIPEVYARNGRFGYIDMPPFPPGITRDEDQREQASSGRFEAFAMWGLGIYARIEKLLPTIIRRKQSHIVYAFFSQ